MLNFCSVGLSCEFITILALLVRELPEIRERCGSNGFLGCLRPRISCLCNQLFPFGPKIYLRTDPVLFFNSLAAGVKQIFVLPGL